MHVALLVDDLDAVLAQIAASGWEAAGKSQTLKAGPNAGKRVVYVRDPDGTTIEFMELPRRISAADFADSKECMSKTDLVSEICVNMRINNSFRWLH